MVPKFIPKNQRPYLIPRPLEFPGRKTPVRALDLYLIRSAERVKEVPQERLFVHFCPDTQLFTTHFRRWVAETIRLTYENSSESDLPKIRAHDVRVVTASIACYRNTPWSELCGWKSTTTYGTRRPTLTFRTSLWWPLQRPCPKGRSLGYWSLTTSTNVSWLW